MPALGAMLLTRDETWITHRVFDPDRRLACHTCVKSMFAPPSKFVPAQYVPLLPPPSPQCPRGESSWCIFVRFISSCRCSVALHRAATFNLNCTEFPNSCPRRDFPVLHEIGEMFIDGGDRDLEQLGHEFLHQPDGFILHPDFNAALARALAWLSSFSNSNAMKKRISKTGIHLRGVPWR
jgi:hypothetical protein